jgi:DNA-binding IclR family transcriptional regulator
VGKAVLGALPEAEWARFLPPEPFPALTPRTHRSLADLRVDVLEARSRGWAGDEEESELSGVCVAAAIVGRDGRPVAAISVTSVAGRLPVEARAPLGRSVQRWCEQISAELRGRTRRDAVPGDGVPPRLELVSPAQPPTRRRS